MCAYCPGELTARGLLVLRIVNFSFDSANTHLFALGDAGPSSENDVGKCGTTWTAAGSWWPVGIIPGVVKIRSPCTLCAGERDVCSEPAADSAGDSGGDNAGECSADDTKTDSMSTRHRVSMDKAVWPKSSPVTSSSGGTPNAPFTRSQTTSLRGAIHARAQRTHSRSSAAGRSTRVSQCKSCVYVHCAGSPSTLITSFSAPCGSDFASSANIRAVGEVLMSVSISAGRSMKGR